MNKHIEINHPALLVTNFINNINYPNHLTATEHCKYVYLIFNPLNNHSKIGITNNIKQRLKKLHTSSGIDFQLLIYIKLQPDYDENAKYIESYLHNYFNDKRILGEWFNLSIKDILAIRQLFWEIHGDDINDNVKQYFLNNNKIYGQNILGD